MKLLFILFILSLALSSVFFLSGHIVASVVVGQVMFFAGIIFSSPKVKQMINRARLKHTIKNFEKYEWQDYDFNGSWRSLGSSKKEVFVLKDVLDIAGLTLKWYKDFYLISGSDKYLHIHDQPYYFGSSLMLRSWVRLKKASCADFSAASEPYLYSTLSHVKEQIINYSAFFYSKEGKDYPYEGESFTDDRIDITSLSSYDCFISKVKSTPGVGSDLMLKYLESGTVKDCKMMHDYLYHKKVFYDDNPEMKNVPEEWIIASYL